jgi:predicted MFS family arabinose efflux permease
MVSSQGPRRQASGQGVTEPETLSPLRTLPWRRLILAILLVALSTQPTFLVAASFLQLQQDIGLTTTALGALTAAFFLTAAMTSTPLGRLVDRIGWQRAMQINVAGSAVVLVLMATVARSFSVLLVLLVVAGAFYGFANPAANKSLAERVDPSRRALIFGLKHAGIPASTLLAGLALPLIIVRWSWPAAFGAALLLVPVVWFLIASDRESTEPIPAVDEPGRGARPLTVWDLATLAGAAALCTTAAMSLSVFLVEASVEEASLSESTAGVLLFAGSLASIAGRMTAGVVTDRAHGRGFASLVVLMGTGSLVFFLLPMSTGAGFFVLVLAAFATGWGWPGMMTFTVVNANTESVAASSSITQAGIFLGAGTGPVLLGLVIDATSFHTSWLVVAAALLVAATIVTVVGLSTQRRRSVAAIEGDR